MGSAGGEREEEDDNFPAAAGVVSREEGSLRKVMCRPLST